MADFSDTEKLNAVWKHVFDLLGTNNLDGANGRFPYEEPFRGTHITIPADIWSEIDQVPVVTTQSDARTAAGSSAVIQDYSQSENVSLSANGGDWDLTTSSLVPEIGNTITDTFPNPSVIRSITNVIDNGGSNYTITLSDNTGISAGANVLQNRIYLTEDISTNGKAWFARTIVGDNFSGFIQNFIPRQFGQGYTVRLFEADGTEIFTTQGAWIFNYQKGMLLFADGQTATDLGYVTPLYIEAFAYIGEFGGTGGSATLPSGTTNDTFRYNGSSWEATSSLQLDGTDVFVQNDLEVNGSLIISSGGAIPANSGDLQGAQEGEIRYDDNFVYHFTNGRWARFQKNEF